MKHEAELRKLREAIRTMRAMNQRVGNVGAPPAAGPTVPFSATNKTESAGAAWMANQMGFKDIIGSSDQYLGDRNSPGTPHFEHLERFRGGAHSFIVPIIHYKIFGLVEEIPEAQRESAEKYFKGWGAIDDAGKKDFNFVAPLADADALVAAASASGGGGLFELEAKLGIPCGSWVRQCELRPSAANRLGAKFGIYRYIVNSPREGLDFNLRVPSGFEKMAYGSWWSKDADGKLLEFTFGEWQPGGTTSGSAVEAVIDAIPRGDLMKHTRSGRITVTLDTSLSAQTEAVCAMASDPKAAWERFKSLAP